MKCKLTGAAGLAGAFLAGMLVATMMGGGMAPAGAKTLDAEAQGQQVILQKVLSPTVSDEDIALLRKDIRAMKTQVIGQNMPLSGQEGRDIFSIRSAAVHDRRFAIVFADSAGAFEGVAGNR